MVRARPGKELQVPGGGQLAQARLAGSITAGSGVTILTLRPDGPARFGSLA